MPSKKIIRTPIAKEPISNKPILTKFRIPSGNKLENTIIKSLEQDYKVRMGVTNIPSFIKADIKKEAIKTAQVSAAENFSKLGNKVAKNFFEEKNLTADVKSRLSQGLIGVKSVTQTSEMDKILEESAKILFKKMNALKKAGFTDDQAFQLIIAEVSSRKPR